MTATRTSSPAAKMALALPATTATTTVVMARTEIQGRAGSALLTRRGRKSRMTSPSSTGNSTIWTMDHAMEPASTGMYCPASHNANTGVSSGAISVETVVIATDKATSPLARYETTLEAVPPGQQPTRITPAASAGGSPNAAATNQPRNGMMAYC